MGGSGNDTSQYKPGKGKGLAMEAKEQEGNLNNGSSPKRKGEEEADCWRMDLTSHYSPMEKMVS